MKEKERDSVDDLLQSKLRDLEVDVAPGDWEAIADRLPRQVRFIPFYRRIAIGAAAAVAALLMVVSSLYLFDKPTTSDPIVQEIQRQTEELLSPTYTAPEATAQQPVIAQAVQNMNIQKDDAMLSQRKHTPEEVDQSPRGIEEEREISAATSEDEARVADVAEESYRDTDKQVQVKEVMATEIKKRKWGFGMGAGAVSVGSNNVVPSYLVTTMGLRGEDLAILNAPSGGKALPKTDVHHNKPLSFGLGISYFLNDRISLNTGLAYTYLSSDWKTNDEYRVKTTQKLHFVGIPLGVTYRIATWQRFNLYASAGVQVDMNVAGRQKGELVRDALITDVVIDSEVRSVREKKLLLSANAKVGISYPVLRFLSAYVEGGAGYYFDNGSALFDKMSAMPTIYSEKPFNLTLQAGFRLGF